MTAAARLRLTSPLDWFTTDQHTLQNANSDSERPRMILDQDRNARIHSPFGEVGIRHPPQDSARTLPVKAPRRICCG